MSHKWHLGQDIAIERCGPDSLEIKIGDKKAKILTEDLMAVVAEELPADRADKLLSVIDEKQVRQGKMKVVVEAKNDIKKGEKVMFVLDVTRYLDSVGNPTGIRATKSGIIY